MKWFEDELKKSTSNWKIPFFHHPLYSSGERHGSDIRLRQVIEPMLLANDVTVVFTGHDHFYERTKPQNGITYFVVGSGGKLRAGNIDTNSGITARGSRYRPGVPGRGDRRRPADLQHHLAHRRRRRLRRDHSPPDQVIELACSPADGCCLMAESYS